MRYRFLIIIVFAFSFTVQAQLSTKDSISVVYDSIFKALKKDYLFKEKVSWKALETEIRKKASQEKSVEESLKHSTSLFDSIKGNHCQIFSETGWYGSTLNKGFTQDDFSMSFLEKHEATKGNPGFKVNMLDNEYGYVMIPGMLLLNVSQDSLNTKSQFMYDEIMKTVKNKSPKGWIIDLRFNIGGNVYPMLASLYHFLGDGTVYYSIDTNEIATPHSLKKGAFYSNEKFETKVVPLSLPDTEIPVVLIVGKMTSSAGEDVVLGFRGRKNVLIVGEESYGFLTGNDMAELPFGIKMAYTTGFLTDKTKVYTPTIVPDVLIDKGDDFENLLQDKNIMEAIKFINSK